MRSSIARQLLPFPDPRIPIGNRFTKRYRVYSLNEYKLRRVTIKREVE